MDICATEDELVRLEQDLDRKGWAVLRNAVSAEGVAAVKAWLADRSSTVGERPWLQPEFEQEPAAGAAPAVRKMRRLFWDDPDFWVALMQRERVFDLARRFVGQEPALVFHAAFMKPAGVGSRVVYHQDQALWSYQYPRSINMWLATSAADRDNGCLQFCSGSHRGGLYPHRMFDDSPFHAGVLPEEVGFEPEAAVMEPGDLVLWDRHTIHGSEENRSTRGRDSVVMVFVDASSPEFRFTDCFPVPAQSA